MPRHRTRPRLPRSAVFVWVSAAVLLVVTCLLALQVTSQAGPPEALPALFIASLALGILGAVQAQRGNPRGRHRHPSPVPSPRTHCFLLALIIIPTVLLLHMVDPTAGAIASPYYHAPVYEPTTINAPATGVPQYVTATGTSNQLAARDSVTVIAAPLSTEQASEPTAATPSRRVPTRATPADPGTARAIAQGLVSERGWSSNQYDCLTELWDRESNWRVDAENTGSGAYGIPQALPGTKMASAGADWQVNPETQIRWGLGYIEGRYGSPCGAWAHSEDVGWY